MASEPSNVTFERPGCARAAGEAPLRVLLAVDGSPASLTAAALVGHLFPGSNCSITVLAVRENERGEWISPLGPAVDALCHCAGTISTELRHGKAGEEIVRFAAERVPDLVVLGSHGRRGLTRLVLGSVAEHVLHHTAAPVLIARRERVTRAIVGIEGFHGRPRAVEILCRLLLLPESDIRVFHALAEGELPPGAAVGGPPVAAPHAELKKEARHASLTRLEEMAADLRAAGLRASVELAEVEPATGLLTLARDLEADLIALGRHHRGPAARFLLGSVSDRVVREARCSVLVVTDQDAGLAPAVSPGA